MQSGFSNNKIDGLEIFVKVKIGDALTSEEKKIYNSYDQEEKDMIFEFINNPVFIDDLNHIIHNIKLKKEKVKHK